ncbi:hypothetical protein BDZ45DRAFT_779100 [Acephala macrosclerotiorum]|nr:hypothetical protein BDZ45DRAFT_779100 [Acephala macrosclerotiorum]
MDLFRSGKVKMVMKNLEIMFVICKTLRCSTIPALDDDVEDLARTAQEEKTKDLVHLVQKHFVQAVEVIVVGHIWEVEDLLFSREERRKPHRTHTVKPFLTNGTRQIHWERVDWRRSKRDIKESFKMATQRPLWEQLQKMNEKKRLLLLLDIFVIEYFFKERLAAPSRICQCVYPSINLLELLSQQKIEGATKICEDELSVDGELQVEDEVGDQEEEIEEETAEETEEEETEEYSETKYRITISPSTPTIAEPPMMAESKREVAEEHTRKIISDLRISNLAAVDLDDVEKRVSTILEPFHDEPRLNVPGGIEWKERRKTILESLYLYQKNIGLIFHPFGDLPGELRHEIYRAPAVIKLRLSLQSSASTVSITNNTCLQNDSRILRTLVALHTPDCDVCVCYQDHLHCRPKTECFDSNRGMAKDYFWDPKRYVIHLSQSENDFDVSWFGTRMRIAGVKRIVLEQELFLSLADNEILRGEELETIFVACEKFSIRTFLFPPRVLSYDSIVQRHLDLKGEELSKLVGTKKVIVVGDISQLEKEGFANRGRKPST